MDENVVAAVASNETKAFAGIEPFYATALALLLIDEHAILVARLFAPLLGDWCASHSGGQADEKDRD